MAENHQEWQAKGNHEDYLLPNGLMLEVREQWPSLHSLLTAAAQDYYHQSEGNATEKVAFIERNLTEIKLREEAMRVLNLLPFRPLEGVLATIRDTGESATVLGQVLNSIQGNLRRAIDFARETHCLRGHSNSVLSVALSHDGERIVSASADKTVRLWRGGWQAWLAVCCNRLRYHPVFKDPPDELARQACEVCRRLVWEEG